MWQQYPANADVPKAVAGLRLLDDARSTRTARELRQQAQSRNWWADQTFAAVYDGGPGWRVTVYGTTGFRWAPESDLKAEIDHLTAKYQLTDVRDVEPGSLGGHQRCGFGFADGDDLVLCGWADHGSLGIATFSAGSLEKDAGMLRELREQIVVRE
jgi:hypothetical protein